MGPSDRRTRALAVVSRLTLVAIVAVACTQTRGNDYGTAAVGLGATVIGAGVNRALTGGCWANCQKGFYCNREKGICERGECETPCREGDYCVRESTYQFRCVTPPGSFVIGQPPPDAGTDASVPSTDAATPLSDAGAAVPSDAAVDGS
jgi:hypothetical protein